MNVSGPADQRTIVTIGRYWHELLSDRSWVRRRVETKALVDESHIEARVSLDINVETINRHARDARCRFDGLLPIPLVAHRKELQLDLDVRDASGNSCSLLTSDSDSHIAHAYFLYVMTQQGFPPAVLTEKFREESFKAIRNDNGTDILLVRVDGLRAELSSGQKLSPEDKLWKSLLENSTLYDLLVDLSSGYFLICRVSDRLKSTILKYRRLAEIDTHNLTVPMALGLEPLRLRFAAPQMRSAHREHVRVVAPAGTEVVRANMLTADGVESKVPYPKRIDQGRAVFYTTDDWPSKVFTVDVVTHLSAIFVPALICSFTTLVLAGSALYLERFDHRFSDQGGVSSASAIVTILALMPTLFALFLVQNGEHRVVARMHSAPRLLLMSSALALLMCAGAIAVRVTPSTLDHALVITTLLAGLTSMLFLAACLSIARLRRRRRRANQDRAIG